MSDRRLVKPERLSSWRVEDGFELVCPDVELSQLSDTRRADADQPQPVSGDAPTSPR